MKLLEPRPQVGGRGAELAQLLRPGILGHLLFYPFVQIDILKLAPRLEVQQKKDSLGDVEVTDDKKGRAIRRQIGNPHPAGDDRLHALLHDFERIAEVADQSVGHDGAPVLSDEKHADRRPERMIADEMPEFVAQHKQQLPVVEQAGKKGPDIDERVLIGAVGGGLVSPVGLDVHGGHGFHADSPGRDIRQFIDPGILLFRCEDAVEERLVPGLPHFFRDHLGGGGQARRLPKQVVHLLHGGVLEFLRRDLVGQGDSPEGLAIRAEIVRVHDQSPALMAMDKTGAALRTG